MHAVLRTAHDAALAAEEAAAGGDDGPTTPGWYVYDPERGEWHGSFADYAEACHFVQYCESDERLETRHNLTLRAGA